MSAEPATQNQRPIPIVPGHWPLIGHTTSLLRQRTAFTSALSSYGDVVKIYLGPLPTYVVTSPDLVYRLLVVEGSKFDKGILFDRFRPYFGNGIAMSNGDFHKQQRRLVQPAFHRDRLARYAETMAQASQELVESWKPGETVELDQSLQHLVVTIVGRTLFSAELGGEMIAEAQRSMPIIIKQGMVRALSPGIVAKLPIPGNRQFDHAIARLQEIIQGLIAARRQDPADRGDLLSALLLARDEDTDESMDDQQIYDEVVTLLTGGIETTALALAWFFHEVTKHPDIEQRIFAEIDQVFADEPVTLEGISHLDYTQRAVTEVLRKYPIWLLMRRSHTDVELGGFHIAAGSEVAFSPHALHHDPRYYPDPERFDPDRWLPERAAALPKGAYIPFGAGARQCIGNLFARNEIAIVVATIMKHWRLIPVPGKPVRAKITGAAYPSQLPMTVGLRHA